jgi:hypothetical protein
MEGTCSICEELPTKIAIYRMEGISVIERYCGKCLEKLSLDRFFHFFHVFIISLLAVV